MDASTYAIAISSLKLTEKIAKDDEEMWGRLTRSFVNRWVSPSDLSAFICEGRPYTSWHDPEYRHHSNWQLSQFLAVDLDTCDARSALPFLASNDFVMGFATLIHTTPSHKEDAPRSRIVFCLDRVLVDANAYNEAAKFLSLLLGGDPVSTDCSRFFYGNAHAKVELLGGRLPVAYLRTLYQKYKSHLEREKHKESDQLSYGRSNNHANHSTMAHHRQPSKPQARFGRTEDVLKLLDKIDPWNISYMEWVACIGAIKHELGDQGLSVAVQWGNGKKGEIERMWKSMRRDNNGHVATFGTLVHLAYPGRH